ncbi:DUF5959 family protein [Streptomyces sp. NPDC059378]|uniref:DUF5959 family protein n=1 Tax=Streptomyces sp. NPDC059378 TaxID=3346815 RepID=UPI0036BEC2E7
MSGFAQGRLEVCLARDDLDCWSQVLGALAAGRDAVWMDDGRNPEIRFEPPGRNRVAVIVVADVAGSGTSVRVPVRLTDGWVDERNARLEHVRTTWPEEVVPPSLGVHERRR